MFGLVTANLKELTQQQRRRYGAVYCGICRRIRMRADSAAHRVLSYDMAFLALLLMSLYEPQEEQGSRACRLHPLSPRAWLDNEYVAYAADMNLVLAYYKALDDWNDDRKRAARRMVRTLEPNLPELESEYPRQCGAIAARIAQLSGLERAGCANPDLSANCFGELMGELLVYRADLWEPELRRLGRSLGRFIYLADAALDYHKDEKSGKYNPFAAMQTGEDWQRWEQYLVMDMAAAARSYEMLPLVQDKALLDNIIYSGVWINYRRRSGSTSGGET